MKIVEFIGKIKGEKSKNDNKLVTMDWNERRIICCVFLIMTMN